MTSPIGKVIGSFAAGGLAVVLHMVLPPSIDPWAQGLLLQLCLHFGITYFASEPKS